MRGYDWDDVAVRNPHRQLGWGWANMAPQIIAGDMLQDFPRPQRYSGRPLCSETDPELFYPPAGSHHMARVAKGICHACPIELECREIHLREQHGIWGGLGEQERRELRMLRKGKR